MLKIQRILPITLIILTPVLFTSCESNDMEEAGDNIEEMADDTGDAMENAAENVEDAAEDAWDEVEDMGDGKK